jgi:hypothetical protein
MHVTYGRERSKTARRATADIVSNSAQRGLDEGRNEPLTAYIITADGKELYAIVLTKSAGVHRCFYFQSASSARPDSNHSQTTAPIQHHISRNSTCRPRRWAVYYRVRQRKLPCSSLAQISGGISWSRTDLFWPGRAASERYRRLSATDSSRTLLGHSGRSRSMSTGGPQRAFLGLLPGAR